MRATKEAEQRELEISRLRRDVFGSEADAAATAAARARALDGDDDDSGDDQED